MKGILHAVIGTPESSRRSTLHHAVETIGARSGTPFLLPKDLNSENFYCTHWEWKNKEFIIQNLVEESIDEWFLFFSNKLDLAEQIESLKHFLDRRDGLNIGRILSFFNLDYLEKTDKKILNWIDACAHFSDVFCFSNRNNKNTKALNLLVDRYKNMRYPMETFILSKKKTPPIDQILCQVPRRISHIFDPLDILEPEETLENDPFLSRQPNGKRNNPLIIPKWKKNQ